MSELIDFLLPKLDDFLQMLFLIAILVMMAYTTIGAHWAARPDSWERKWNRGKSNRDDNGLDIEHGSVTDLWHAVATSSEKLAEIMPGMLLVVGLLGTFLGLGLALNHASNILGQSNAVADSMGDLLGLLRGLGTKFKTSTWGIIGFLLLKIWSEVTRFDEKRLVWVINKVKAELARRARERQDADNRRQQALFQQISNASAVIVRGISDAATQSDRCQQQLLTGIQDTLTQSHVEASAALYQANERVLQNLDSVRDVLTRGIDRVDQTLLSTTGTVHETLVAIQKAQQSASEELTGFTQGTQEIVRQMAEGATTMASGSEKVSEAAHGLKTVVQEFGTEFRSVLNDVRGDLSAAIRTMSERSAATMKEGSEKLECATREISESLSTLSDSVKETMGQVETSIRDALKIQENSSRVFTASAEILNENITATTLTTRQLGEDIKAGLASVAKAGQHMRVIGNSLVKQAPILERVSSRRGFCRTACRPARNRGHWYLAKAIGSPDSRRARLQTADQ